MRKESFYLVPITSISKRRSVHAEILNWINNNAYHIELLSRLNNFNMFVFTGRILYNALDEWRAEVNQESPSSSVGKDDRCHVDNVHAP